MGQAYAGMNRRDVLKTLGAIGALGALGHRPAAPAGTSSSSASSTSGPRDDYGYNQAHAAGRRRDQEAARRQGPRGGEGPRDRSTCRRPWRA